MSISTAFSDFLDNIAIDNAETISLRYGEVTRALNMRFRDTESRTANTLQVGSYGRRTAIKGVSDLDMLFIMPASKWDDYSNGGQSKLLTDAANAIKARYPNTTVKVDRLVVQIQYQGFQIEAQPVFKLVDGSFRYPDTYRGGSWKTTKPEQELTASSQAQLDKNNNFRPLCKMVRAWRNRHGVQMGGLLIDTLVYKFLYSTSEYDSAGYRSYPQMVEAFFAYLADLPVQHEYGALGSNQRVKVKKRFQRRAREAQEAAAKAAAEVDEAKARAKWRKLFGRAFPLAEEGIAESVIYEAGYQARNTEEFPEEVFSVDIRYTLKIDCEVKQNGFQTLLLRAMLVDHLPLFTQKSLRFKIVHHDIPESIDHQFYWKVLNRGPVAVKRDCIRGQIVPDEGQRQKIENTNFRGDHIVECYAVSNGVVIARDRIKVPIREEA
ncbi:SMODS domain-containing nucleotidyltransferase [Porphyrobacter sp. CACIAM 03H1]|uniref:SMODS domain-containing nucleotidyltransferase n=1 Tax=Porphyrobacter sp. CACIAM 03H1 TaxID=2003315 RepID=UPI000B5A4E6F|nr:nucleotidyltransferase [Porphyrobacter sp. CACIAM 03H1]ASJ91685.1 nucleotidyltransferase [Porphyrobacter sp. CACIAM 03H1]